MPIFDNDLHGYGYLLANGGVAYRPSNAFRLTGGLRAGWAQPLSGESGFVLSALSVATTFSF